MSLKNDDRLLEETRIIESEIDSYLSSAKKQTEERLSHVIDLYNQSMQAMKHENYREAAELLKEAVEPYDAEGMYNWGVAYLNGTGIPCDKQNALLWLYKSAEKGYGPAARALSTMYYQGNGVEKDLGTAAKWAVRGANKGDADSMAILALILEEQDSSPEEMTKAAGWMKKAADKGNNAAAFNYGLWSYEGELIRQNIPEAKTYLKKYRKSRADDTLSLNDEAYYYAQYVLGKICYYGEDGLPADLIEAVQYFRDSAAEGIAEAQYMLGKMLYEGKGCDMNKQEGILWLKKAAENGEESAASMLKRIRNN